MSEAGITVTGTGEVRRRPSQSVARIGVSVTRPTLRQATDDASTRAQAVIAALVATGLASDDVQTTTISVGPFHEHVPGAPPRLVGYTFTNMLSAVMRDLDTVGTVLDAALAAGGEDAVLDGIAFSAADDNSDALAQARTAAYADAHDKAKQLADLAGVTLGAPVSIDETAGGNAPRDLGMARMAMSADSLPIAAGQIPTAVHLRVCFAIV